MTTLLEATVVHILLAYSGLAIAVAIGISLAVLSLRSRTAGAIISTITGIGQAIPILALVAFMVPLAGIGFLPSGTGDSCQHPDAHCPEHLCRDLLGGS